MIRLVFASDSHLNKHYARMTPEQLAGRRDKLRRAWQQSVDFALTEGADFYLHGGDLFDGPNPRATEMVWVGAQLKRLADAGVATLLLGGNHDTPKSRLGGVTPQRLFEAVGLARVFSRPGAVEWVQVEKEGLRLAIGGLAPDPRLGRRDDPLAALEEPIEPPEADCVLLLAHHAVEGSLHPDAEEPVIARASIAALAGKVDHLLLGHVHAAKDQELAGVGLHFPGPTERMGFGELEVRCGFLALRVEGRRPCKVTLRHIHIDPQPMRRETVRATNIPAEEPSAWLAERLRAWSAPDQILQLRLEGPLPRSRYQALRFLELWQLGQELNFYFDLDRHLLTVQGDDPGELALSGDRLSPRAEILRVAEGFAREAEAGRLGEADRALVEAARDLALAHYGAGAIEDEGGAP